MNYTEYDLGVVAAGKPVVVTLEGTEANVLLVDTANLAAFKARRNYEYFGGHTTKSPVKLTTPRTDHWHVVINLGGYGGAVRTSVKVGV